MTIANSDPVVSRRLNVRDAIIVSLCVLIGLMLRLDFMRAAAFTIDSDEAIVGLMARDILLGRGIPVFYYGQHYMGSLEAILASISFAVLGSTPFTLQLVPLVWSLALIVLAYALGRELGGRRSGLVASMLMAVPPPALLVWSSKARGGFIEVVVLGAIALLIGMRWLRTHPERLKYPCLLGLVLGLGWWVNNQILYFLVPLSIAGAIHGFSRTMRLAAPGVARSSTYARWRGVLAIVAVGGLAFIVGGAPYWWYNVTRGFPSAGMFKLASWSQFLSHLEGLWSTALPAILGAQRFWQREPAFFLSKYLAVLLYVVPICMLILSRWDHVLGLFRGRIDRRHPIELLVIFCLSCGLIFAVSSFGWLVQAPRYLLPLYVGLYPLIAVCCDRLLRRSRGLGAVHLGALIAFQITASYAGGRALSGEPMVFGGNRVARDHAPVIESLQRLGISRIRANYWIGYRLAFETGEQVTFTVLGEPTQVRIPRYEETDHEQRALLPLVLVQTEVAVVKPVLKRFGYSFKEERAGEYTILYDIVNDQRATSEVDLSSIGYLARANVDSSAEMALDGDLQTRWGTGEPQRPGQTYEIELLRPTEISGIRYAYGAWFSDHPVELKVEVEDDNGKRRVVLSQRESPGAMHLSARDPHFTLRFDPILARRIILTQLGRHSVLDWSIAEISILGNSDREEQDVG